MKRLRIKLERLFIKITGYTYTNLGRLFIRLFVGLMFMQFGIRHLIHFTEISNTFPGALGMSHETSLIVMITIELVCSLFIMTGFLTRLATIPPILSMIVAEHYILADMQTVSPYLIDSVQPGYLPIMFIGIYFYIILAGPGKISLDYFISLYLLSSRGKDDNRILDEA
ncbi:MAG: DoxX family protein [Pseudoflavonifractor sp.]|nr:DoxX family protein [Pseudoflavonifractor sp.]